MVYDNYTVNKEKKTVVSTKTGVSTIYNVYRNKKQNSILLCMESE